MFIMYVGTTTLINVTRKMIESKHKGVRSNENVPRWQGRAP